MPNAAATPQNAVPAKRARAAAPAKKRAPAKAAQPATVKAVAKPAKAPHKREKLVRDSFTMPKTEYAVLDTLKQRATGLKQSVKKSELLRAGVKALAAMSNAAFLAALSAVPAIKTGRPVGKAAAPAQPRKASTPKAT